MELTPMLRAEVFPQSDGGHRVYLRGELDLLSREELLDALRGPMLILDLADLSFIDASGIGTILEVRQRI
jgi:anti-anti-sigma regulatory factor